MTASAPFRIDLSLNETTHRLTGLQFVNRFAIYEPAFSIIVPRSVNRPNRHIPTLERYSPMSFLTLLLPDPADSSGGLFHYKVTHGSCSQHSLARFVVAGIN